MEVFVNKNLVSRLFDLGTPTETEIFVGKIFVKVCLHTKVTTFLPHGNYPLYGIYVHTHVYIAIEWQLPIQ